MKPEDTPVEQGARDACQLAINALERARECKGEFAFCDNIDTALLEVGVALFIQRADQFEDMATATEQEHLKNHPSVNPQGGVR